MSTQREAGSVRFAVKALVLFGLWLLFSGLYTPLPLALGAVSSLFVALVAKRMGLLEADPGDIGLHPLRCLAYVPWLAWQVAKSNVDVALRILVPSKGISPRVIRVPSTQRSDVARTVYANSITLTPGTISIDVSGDEITVHALSREGAEDLTVGEMGDRVTALERER
jgi:multicomponent Na+:H+ antiporter subunit E